MIPGLGSFPGEVGGYLPHHSLASLVAQMINNLPAMWETWVQSLVWEDPLEWERLPTLVFWPGELHGQRSLAGYGPWGHRESHD